MHYIDSILSVCAFDVASRSANNAYAVLALFFVCVFLVHLILLLVKLQ